MEKQMNFAGIEAGGTKFVLALSNENLEILKRQEILTTTPDETFKHVYNFFKDDDFVAIGIGSFGPIDPNKKSKKYGYITKTPKSSWNNFNIVKTLEDMFNVPVAFNTDVNVAALAESKYGAANGIENCLYITIGTGIGAGAVIDGNMLNGMIHPEMGHIKIQKHPNDTFPGICPFHGDCLEGLASGPAIEQRWGNKAINLSNEIEVWELEAFYIAQGLSNLMLILSPEKIIIGGGVSKQKQLFPLIKENFLKNLNNYVSSQKIYEDDFICSPVLGLNSGIIGSLLIAKEIYYKQ